MSDSSPDSYARELDEAVGDGGGCVEAWEAATDVRSRRSFLGGAATISLAVLGTGPGLADADVDEDEIYRELDDEEAWEVLTSFFWTDEFRRIYGHVRTRDEDLDLGESIVARVEREDADVEIDIVNVPIAETDAIEAHAVLGRDRTSDEITMARLEYILEREDGAPTKRRLIDVDDGYDEWEWEVDPEYFDEYEGDVSCTGCQAAIVLLCQIGCHTPTAFICGVLTGANVIAGGACFGFTQVACGVISTLGCGTPADDICAHPDLGLC